MTLAISNVTIEVTFNVIFAGTEDIRVTFAMRSTRPARHGSGEKTQTSDII